MPLGGQQDSSQADTAAAATKALDSSGGKGRTDSQSSWSSTSAGLVDDQASGQDGAEDKAASNDGGSSSDEDASPGGPLDIDAITRSGGSGDLWEDEEASAISTLRVDKGSSEDNGEDSSEDSGEDSSSSSGTDSPIGDGLGDELLEDVDIDEDAESGATISPCGPSPMLLLAFSRSCT